MYSLWTSVWALLLLCAAVLAQLASSGLVVFDPKLTTENKPLLALIELVAKSELVDLVYKNFTDEDLALFTGDNAIFDHVFILPSSQKALAKKNFNLHKLVEYFNNNGNVVIVGDHSAAQPDEIRLFLNEVGIYPSPKNYKLMDHFNADKSGKIVLLKDRFVNERILPSKENLAYEGAAAALTNAPYLLPLVKAPKTSFTVSSSDLDSLISAQNTWTFGEQGFLAVAVQALNNARLVWVGSSSLLLEELLRWAIYSKNVLKLQYVQHHRADEPHNLNRTLYRIKDQVIYTVGVSEWTGEKWAPFVAQAGDEIQLAFKMLDPWQRLNLKSLGPVASQEDGELDTQAYFVNFTVPDQHGMFTFELDYKRAGLTYLEDKKIVTVRHLANDEFKRSWDIPNSWLYLASAGLVTVSWLIFVVNFLYIGADIKHKKNI